MTKDEALKLALKFVEDSECGTADLEAHIKEALAQPEHGWTPERIAGMARLKEAQDKKLAQSEQPPYHHFVSDRFNIDPQTGNLNIGAVKKQEPVEWGVDWGPDGNSVSIIKRLADGGIEVVGWEYAPHTPQRTWVGLTDEEIRLQWSEFWEAECHPWAIDFAQAIEAKLRSKNNG